MNKMPAGEERDMLNSLSKVVSATKSGQNPVDSMARVVQDKGYNIEKIARMCEVYNKSKSIHTLSNTPEDTRAESFPLINTQEVLDKIYKPTTEKTAMTMPDLSMVDIQAANDGQLEKAAAECSAAKREYSAPRSTASLCNEACTMRALYKKACAEQDQAIRMTRLKVEMAISDVAKHVQPYSQTQFYKIAQDVVNKYGDRGQQLVDILAAKSKKESRVFQKTAQVAIFQPCEPYITISKTMEYMKAHHKAVLNKEADMLDPLRSITSAATDNALSAAATGEAGPGISAMLRWQRKPEDAKAVFSPVFHNKLTALNAYDGLVNLYTEDDFLKNQKLEDVEAAYNTVLQLVPELANGKNPSVLKSLVKHQLATGTDLEPFAAAQLIDINKKLMDTNKMVGERSAAKEKKVQEIKDEAGKPTDPTGFKNFELVDKDTKSDLFKSLKGLVGGAAEDTSKPKKNK